MPEWCEGGAVEIAWRVLDAQYWGVPQRRKRIFLIADFAGQRASEVLFKPESLPRNLAESTATRERIAGSVEDRIRNAIGFSGNQDGGDNVTEKCPTLRVDPGSGNGCKMAVVHPFMVGNVASTLRAGAGAPKHEADENGRLVIEPIPINDKATRYKGGGDTRNNDGAGNGLGVGKPGDPMPTLTAGDRHAVAHPIAFGNEENNEVANTLLAKSNLSYRRDMDNLAVVGTLSSDYCGFISNQSVDAGHVVATVDCRNLNENEEISGTLQCKSTGGYSLNYQNPVRIGYAVRRLTPTECERLQGFPDGWTAGGVDTSRYKALGNSVAVPCVEYIIGNIAEVLREAGA